MGLTEETVNLVHLVYPGFRPAFFFNDRVDLLAEGFDIFRIGKKTVHYLRDRLLACNYGIRIVAHVDIEYHYLPRLSNVYL